MTRRGGAPACRRPFILVDRVPVATDFRTWAAWQEQADPKVAFDQIGPGVVVSTVFLGLDYRRRDDDAPLMFETTVFGDPQFVQQARYSTWEQAEKGHRRMCARWRAARASRP